MAGPSLRWGRVAGVHPWLWESAAAYVVPLSGLTTMAWWIAGYYWLEMGGPDDGVVDFAALASAAASMLYCTSNLLAKRLPAPPPPLRRGVMVWAIALSFTQWPTAAAVGFEGGYPLDAPARGYVNYHLFPVVAAACTSVLICSLPSEVRRYPISRYLLFVAILGGAFFAFPGFGQIAAAPLLLAMIAVASVPPLIRRFPQVSAMSLLALVAVSPSVALLLAEEPVCRFMKVDPAYSDRLFMLDTLAGLPFAAALLAVSLAGQVALKRLDWLAR